MRSLALLLAMAGALGLFVCLDHGSSKRRWSARLGWACGVTWLLLPVAIFLLCLYALAGDSTGMVASGVTAVILFLLPTGLVFRAYCRARAG